MRPCTVPAQKPQQVSGLCECDLGVTQVVVGVSVWGVSSSFAEFSTWHFLGLVQQSSPSMLLEDGYPRSRLGGPE